MREKSMESPGSEMLVLEGEKTVNPMPNGN